MFMTAGSRRKSPFERWDANQIETNTEHKAE
jgi:hypothetical protein